MGSEPGLGALGCWGSGLPVRWPRAVSGTARFSRAHAGPGSSGDERVGRVGTVAGWRARPLCAGSRMLP